MTLLQFLNRHPEIEVIDTRDLFYPDMDRVDEKIIDDYCLSRHLSFQTKNELKSVFGISPYPSLTKYLLSLLPMTCMHIVCT